MYSLYTRNRFYGGPGRKIGSYETRKDAWIAFRETGLETADLYKGGTFVLTLFATTNLNRL